MLQIRSDLVMTTCLYNYAYVKTMTGDAGIKVWSAWWKMFVLYSTLSLMIKSAGN